MSNVGTPTSSPCADDGADCTPGVLARDPLVEVARHHVVEAEELDIRIDPKRHPGIAGPGQLRAAGDRQIGKRTVAARRHVTTAAILPLPSSAALPPPTGLATPRWPWKAGRRHRRGDPTLAALSRTETGSAHTGPCETARCCTAARLENFTIVVVVCHASLLWSVLRIHLVPPMNSVTAAATGSGCSTITKCPARGISTTCTRSPNCSRSACPFPGGATTSSRPWITRSGALPPVHHSSRGTPWLVAKCAM